MKSKMKSKMRKIEKSEPQAELLTSRDAAPILGTTPGMLAFMRHKDVGPRYILINTSVRYSREDLLAYRASRTIDPAAGKPAHIRTRRGGPGRGYTGKMARRA